MSALNSVVNKLVRAAASVPAEISDADLDAHVARILAEEAKANDHKWSELGLGAYLNREQGRDSPDPSAPKPNKRLLSSIIRQVDGHNNALLRRQAEAAQQARRAREPERKPRGDGKAGANRLFGGAMRGLGDRERKPSRSDRRENDQSERSQREVNKREVNRRDRSQERNRNSDSHRDRDDRRDRGEGGRERRRGLSPSPARSRSRSPRRRRHFDKEEGDRKARGRYESNDEDRRARRREHRERSRDRRSDKKRDRSRSRDRDHQQREEDHDRSHRRHPRHRSRSRSRSPPPSPPAPPSRSRTRETRGDDRPREPSASPPPPPSRISRMDRYFKRDYDPRLDVGEVPKTGPVTAVGWDNMLAVLKERGKKRRRNSPTLSTSPEPERKSRSNDLPPRTVASSMPADMKEILEMEYTRRGQTRAWDVGKDTED
ncbi:hypothetical protein CC85DRAFT_282016 [Cutaneotrichosporon oleaginosum]|uniref:Uncharacterized protein n=1 Tax=Cutaneotrichosporon oleaginosum TaxID=879819 RepID=A0A0J1BCT1_9TREE|nr:uncharacterized protein CC85DRAFT_282016 [Cutaneotrichosporon oleaginosum]KLT45869.1 hypothetical protein CC85DRAFT_282016 [Cutaneotrichosporon oleaginosum]TXT06571.1 hypothetical protein COLE_05902 [Cutaneotrichosporon oleaginosum]